MVSLALANVSNWVKRNVKALSPGAGDPEWVNNRKEKERKVQTLVHGPIHLARVNQSEALSHTIERKRMVARGQQDGQ